MKKINTIIILICFAAAAQAQSNFSLTYAFGFPTGDMKDFISKASFRGIAADYRYSFKPNMAIGLMLGWNTFYQEEPSRTYQADNVSLTGKQWRYSNNLPMLATFTYFQESGDFVKPFATLGVGTMYTRRNTDMNLYTLEQEAWNFTLQPEIGVQLQTSDNVGVSISGKYLHGFQAGSELDEAQSFFSLNIGFCFY